MITICIFISKLGQNRTWISWTELATFILEWTVNSGQSTTPSKISNTYSNKISAKAIISNGKYYHNQGRKSQFIPCLSLDSDWLTNMKYRPVSHVWRHQPEIKRKERYWWRHNDDHDRLPLSLTLRCDRVTLLLNDDLYQITEISGLLKLWKRFRKWQTSFEHGINSLPLVCFCRYWNLSTLSIAIPYLAFGRARRYDAPCG